MIHALIFAGGVGKRMGKNKVYKQFLTAQSKPIIVHTIEHFQKCGKVDEITVVCVSDSIEYMNSLKDEYGLNKIKSIIPGGRSGQDSIYFGLKEIKRRCSDWKNDIVLIHDGVRPLVNQELIECNIRTVREHGSCVTVCKATESILALDENAVVDQFINRSKCYLGRAPQSFFMKDIMELHERARIEGKEDFVDSAMMMKYYERPLYTVIGPDYNIKITTMMDYYLFKAILDAKENEQFQMD